MKYILSLGLAFAGWLSYAQPTANLRVSNANPYVGESVTLTWSSTNARNGRVTRPFGTSGVIVASGTEGSVSVSSSSAQTITYTFTAYEGDVFGNVFEEATVTVTWRNRPEGPGSQQPEEPEAPEMTDLACQFRALNKAYYQHFENVFKEDVEKAESSEALKTASALMLLLLANFPQPEDECPVKKLRGDVCVGSESLNVDLSSLQEPLIEDYVSMTTERFKIDPAFMCAEADLLGSWRAGDLDWFQENIKPLLEDMLTIHRLVAGEYESN